MPKETHKCTKKKPWEYCRGCEIDTNEARERVRKDLNIWQTWKKS